jgi:Protein of unknown function (DUF3501)
MNRVTRGEILGLGAYEEVREHFRGRIIADKKRRRLAVGPHLTVLFENHDTVLLQIQEMLRTERITREDAVQHEIDTYNEVLGDAHELSATVMIEIPDPAARDAFLVRAKGIERHLVLMVGDEAVRGIFDPSRVLPDQASAVMYVKFSLSETAVATMKSGQAEVAFVVDHPDTMVRVAVSSEIVRSLAGDLSP